MANSIEAGHRGSSRHGIPDQWHGIHLLGLQTAQLNTLKITSMVRSFFGYRFQIPHTPPEPWNRLHHPETVELPNQMNLDFEKGPGGKKKF